MHQLYAHLSRFAAADWRRAVDVLSAEVHDIDRTATRIWFAFFPLHLHLALAESSDPDALARRMGLMGRWRLADQIDSSHRFLFAHRYWPQVKLSIQNYDQALPDLAPLITTIAEAGGRTARVDREFLLGIVAVGLMTLRQVGPEAFAAAPGKIHLSERARALSPHQILRRRAKDDGQGPLGFLRGARRNWTVTFDENEPDASFSLIEGQPIASAAETDKRDYRSSDPRCTPGEGPIPVECRAASCGTCWVGVLGGAEKLSPVVDRDERRRMTVFGYEVDPVEKPIIRLACQAKPNGAVSIVIPPWNGMFGNLISRP